MRNTIKFSGLVLALLTTSAFANSTMPAKKDLLPHKSHHSKEGKKFGESSAKKINIKMLKSSSHKLPKAFRLQNIEIKVDGESADDQLKDLYTSYIGKIFTDQDLFSLNEQIVKTYHKAGYLLPRPYIVKHDLKTGSLVIGVMLDSIKDVVIIGDGESSELMKKYAKKIVNSVPAKTKDVQRYIGLISKLPGFTTEYTMRESDVLEANPDANPIELVLITSKMKASSHARIDNFGVKNTGKYQGSIFTELYSPFNNSELLMLSLSGTDKLDRSSSISAGYEQPINAEGTSLNFIGSYSKNNPTKGLPVKAKDNISYMGGVSVGHYVMMRNKSHLKMNIGADYQNTVGYTIPDEFTSGKSNDSKLYTGNFSVDYMLEDNLGGKNLFEISYTRGMGGKTKYYTTPTNKIDQHFNLVSANYFRDQELANNFSYFAHVGAQTSDKYIPDAENFVMGNRDFGRAYFNTGLASRKGLGFSFEARYTYNTNNMILTEIEPYAYYDIAKIYNKKQANTNVSSLSSAGPGLRFKFANDYMAGAEVAFPFKKKFTVSGEKHKANTNFTFFASKTFKF